MDPQLEKEDLLSLMSEEAMVQMVGSEAGELLMASRCDFRSVYCYSNDLPSF